MDYDKLLEALEAMIKDATDEQATNLRELADAAKRLPELETDLAAANDKVTALEADLEKAEADLEAEKVAREAAQSDLETATEELETLKEFKAEVEAEKAEAEREAIKEARLAQLPESTVKALEAKDEEVRDKVIARWVDMDEDEWDAVVAGFGSPAKKESLAEKSGKEGLLNTGTDDNEGEFAIDKL